MKANERLMIIGAIILSITIMELFIYGGIGVSVAIYMSLYYGFILFYCKKQKIEIKIKNNALLIPILLATLCFALFDNKLLRIFNSLFLWVLTMINTCEILQVNKCIYERYSIRWFLNSIRIGIIKPFSSLNRCLKNICDIVNLELKNKMKNISKILTGVILGTISIGVIIPLLVRSDAAFSGILTMIISNIDFEIVLIILKRIVIFCIVFLSFYSFIFSVINGGQVDEEIKENNPIIPIKLDYTIVMTCMTIVSLVYLLFCASQASYFVSAFEGVLPKNYTYSEYARQGFFECIPLTMINIGFTIILKHLRNSLEDAKKIKVTKSYATFIVLFTLFLVSSALSKMILYISEYGLTIMRVYVAWFLVLLSIILMLILVTIYSSKINILKYTFIVFTIMYMGLNYSNIDYLIGSCNAKLSRENGIETVSAFKSLSISASGPLKEIKELNGESKEIKRISLQYKEEVFNDTSWKTWNLAKHIAKKYY